MLTSSLYRFKDQSVPKNKKVGGNLVNKGRKRGWCRWGLIVALSIITRDLKPNSCFNWHLRHNVRLAFSMQLLTTSGLKIPLPC